MRSERLEQGILYVVDGFSMDPLTPVVIGLAMVVSFMLRERQGIAVALGLVLSSIYVVWIGGDFMSGRMFSSTFFVAVFVLTRQQWVFEPRLLAVPVMLAIMLGAGATNPDILTGKDFRHDQADRDGIVDERRVYFPYTGLLNVMSTGTALTHPWAEDGRRVVSDGRRVAISGATGFFGFVIGRRAHVIDRFALGDAFLARLPAEPGWNIGHLSRRLPGGYKDTIATGRNVIVEPGVAALYDRISLLTRAPLFSARRLHAIWRLQFGGYGDLLEGTSYGLKTIRADELASGADTAAGMPEQGIPVRERGVLVRFDRPLRGADLEVTAHGNDDFFVFYQLGNKTVGRVLVYHAWPGEPSTPHARRLHVPSASLVFDRVLIRPRWTWGPMHLWGARPCL
jgi:arabinofuranosyltransferase